MENILEKIEALVQEDETPVKESFKVHDVQSADWAMAKIRKYEAKKAEAKAAVDAKLAELDSTRKIYTDFLVGEYKEQDEKIAFFQALLLPYITDKLEGAKVRSVKLPNGMVGFRAKAPSFDFDNDKLLAFTKKYKPELVSTITKENVSWGELKKELTVTKDGAVVTPDGEVVEGVKATVYEDTFYYKLT